MGRTRSRGRPGGLTGWFAHPLVVLCAGRTGSTLVLLQTPRKWQMGFWPFCILFINCQNSSQLFLVRYIFFASVAGGDVCSGAGTAAKGPRSQPISLRYVMYLAMENRSGGKWVYLSSGRIILKHKVILFLPALHLIALLWNFNFCQFILSLGPQQAWQHPKKQHGLAVPCSLHWTG